MCTCAKSGLASLGPTDPLPAPADTSVEGPSSIRPSSVQKEEDAFRDKGVSPVPADSDNDSTGSGLDPEKIVREIKDHIAKLPDGQDKEEDDEEEDVQEAGEEEEAHEGPGSWTCCGRMREVLPLIAFPLAILFAYESGVVLRYLGPFFKLTATNLVESVYLTKCAGNHSCLLHVVGTHFPSFAKTLPPLPVTPEPSSHGKLAVVVGGILVIALACLGYTMYHRLKQALLQSEQIIRAALGWDIQDLSLNGMMFTTSAKEYVIRSLSAGMSSLPTKSEWGFSELPFFENHHGQGRRALCSMPSVFPMLELSSRKLPLLPTVPSESASMWLGIARIHQLLNRMPRHVRVLIDFNPEDCPRVISLLEQLLAVAPFHFPEDKVTCLYWLPTWYFQDPYDTRYGVNWRVFAFHEIGSLSTMLTSLGLSTPLQSTSPVSSSPSSSFSSSAQSSSSLRASSSASSSSSLSPDSSSASSYASASPASFSASPYVDYSVS